VTRGPGDIRAVGVVGGGAWGTALAATVARAGRKVTLWARDAETVAAVNARRENPRYLPDVALPEGLEATPDLAAAARADAVLLVVPAQATRDIAAALAPHVAPATPVVLCAKGIERRTGLFPSEVLAEALPRAVPAALSGPSFAADVARGLPTAVTLACRDAALGRRLVEAVGHAGFRPYLSTDLLGVEIGSAVKNVLAIAAGVAAGRGLGPSAEAALVARGFAEMGRFAAALGARRETLAGLSGLGDLILTCTRAESRNRSFGVMLGQGLAPDEARRRSRGVVEGEATAPVLLAKARALDVDMPISAAVAAVLAGEGGVEAAIDGLLARPFRSEAEEEGGAER
jgi:glycerol-3-phosphate dehydrogenase (NAD(P)+)